jgi:hypothetical protein
VGRIETNPTQRGRGEARGSTRPKIGLLQQVPFLRPPNEEFLFEVQCVEFGKQKM